MCLRLPVSVAAGWLALSRLRLFPPVFYIGPPPRGSGPCDMGKGVRDGRFPQQATWVGEQLDAGEFSQAQSDTCKGLPEAHRVPSLGIKSPSLLSTRSYV